MTDIVERLRVFDTSSADTLREAFGAMLEAADEIERLRAALAERGEPVAWLNPVTRFVITDDTKRKRAAYGYGGRVHSSGYTVPLYAAPEVPR